MQACHVDAGMDGSGYLLRPRFLAHDDGETLALVGVPGGDVIELDGLLREGVHAGRLDPALQAAALLDPSLAQVADALGAHGLERLTRANVLRGDGYQQLFIELTAQCNEHCVHCYAESSPQRGEALDLDTVRAVIDDAARLGFAGVQLTGGDPLISAACVPAARHACERGIPRVEVYTNGLALLGETYRALRELGVAFAFSFYSADADEHDAITRTPGSQRRTLEAIRRVTADGLECRASIVVMELNRDRVAATVDCLIDAGVGRDRIGMDVQHSVGRGLMTLRRSEAGASLLDAPFEPGAPRADDEQGPKGGAGHRAQQDIVFGGLAAVSYDGIVFPCIFSRSLPLGDVRQTRLADILTDARPVRVERVTLIEGMSRHQEELSCWECRLRASMLGAGDG